MRIVIESEVDPVAGLLWFWSVSAKGDTNPPEEHWCVSLEDVVKCVLDEVERRNLV